MNTAAGSRSSLIGLFSPPDEKRTGVFGLVCGLSAEDSFIDAALENFTRINSGQRKHATNLSLTLFIDFHNPPLVSVPGLYNAPPALGVEYRKARLMHAKVALLGFGEAAAGKPDYYRLIVSTGNWNKEAVNSNINLVWFCDYNLSDLDSDEAAVAAADILESLSFWERLLGTTDLGAGYYQIAKPARLRVEAFIANIREAIPTAKRHIRPRFISNILNEKAPGTSLGFQADSIGAQVLKRFQDRNEPRRNTLICGSGFFENPEQDSSQEPEVIRDLYESLSESRVLTSRPSKWLMINPGTSGAAGKWLAANKDNVLNWEIGRPRHPDSKTVLGFHAKYVFIGNINAESVTNGFLYLGSGNLSKQGFKLAPGTGGNIEAGVILRTERFDTVAELCTCLGIDPEENLDLNELPDNISNEDTEQSTALIQLPPPIASCKWLPKDCKLTWEWADQTWTDVILHGQTVQLPSTEIPLADGESDFSLGVSLHATRDGKPYDWKIPVFSENNNFCAPPTQPKTGQQIIDALTSFPDCSSEEDGGDDETGEGASVLPVVGPLGADVSELRDELDNFPLHLATTLIETIANRNQQVTTGQLPDWSAKLRRTLIDEMKPDVKRQLANLGWDILAPLKNEPGFAPYIAIQAPSKPFPAISESEINVQIYREVIQAITEDWKGTGNKDECLEVAP